MGENPRQRSAGSRSEGLRRQGFLHRAQSTLHRRALPGHGILPLGTFLDTCEELGLTGVLSVEVLNDDLRALPTGTYAHTVADATNALLAR